MKMSEHFPEAFQVEHNKSFEVQDATWYSYGEKYESDGDQDSAIEHAVLNHDRMADEIAALKHDRDNAISKMSKSWQHNASDYPNLLSEFVDMANDKYNEIAELRDMLKSAKFAMEKARNHHPLPEGHDCEMLRQNIVMAEELLRK